jgi:homocitrate synthase NifV
MVDRTVVLRDATLREGLDVPGVTFTREDRLRLAEILSECGVAEIEVVAPSRVAADLSFARALRSLGLRARATGLLYATNRDLRAQLHDATEDLAWVDLLIPVSPLRRPTAPDEKIELARAAMKTARQMRESFGAGFPNATQVESLWLKKIVAVAVEGGARRITLYDTNGSGDPFRIFDLVSDLVEHSNIPLFFHGHNDLGMATANSLAAVRAGAAGIDVTVNGLGDRAGNCSLEQLAVCLALEDVSTGLKLEQLTRLSHAVATASGIAVSPLAPVTGAYAFSHKSPGHREALSAFEAYDPGLVGRHREFVEP